MPSLTFSKAVQGAGQEFCLDDSGPWTLPLAPLL